MMREKSLYLEETQLLIERARYIQDKGKAKIQNVHLVIYPNVLNPNIFDDGGFGVEEFVKIIPEFHPKQPKVLEIETGAGYTSILAVLNGASHATCTDINLDALRNAEENADKHYIGHRITLKYSDVFSALSFDDKFDTVHVPNKNRVVNHLHCFLYSSAIFRHKKIIFIFRTRGESDESTHEKIN